MIKVYMQWADYQNAIEVAIIDEDRMDGKIFAAKPMNIEFEEVISDAYIKPTLILKNKVGREFMSAMADMLDKNGIKTEKTSKLEGTLEATKYHLEDMRKLLKLKV